LKKKQNCNDEDKGIFGIGFCFVLLGIEGPSIEQKVGQCIDDFGHSGLECGMDYWLSA
jgi:hypothetical protein